MLEKPLHVPSLKSVDLKNHLLVRQKIIDAAEGRLVTVVEEFEKAFDILAKYPNTVTVFGSARTLQSHPVSRQAFAVSWALAKHGYAIVTGGGGGVMQAANHGAKKAGGTSIGFNIHLPTEQRLNPHTTESFQFEHFFGRKVAMTLDASAYIYCGGGFGTLDELFEIVTLTQTGTIPKVPIILMGVDFWKPFDKVIKKVLLEEYDVIDADDIELYHITDDIEEIVAIIESNTQQEARAQMQARSEKQQKRWERQRSEWNGLM